mgnify:CR=1 FL=1
MYRLTEKIKAMQQELEQVLKINFSNRKLIDPALEEAYRKIAEDTRQETAGMHNLVFRARLLKNFAREIPVREEPVFQGSQRFASGGAHGHNVVDYPGMLNDGIPGRRRKIEVMPEGMVKQAFLETLDAFAHYIRRHKGCEVLAERPPENLREALQMVWFMQIFLHVEGASSAVSFGRLDQYLSSYLSDDPEQDFELVCAFLIKCCEGDESQNLTLTGGPLALMILHATRLLKTWQPSLSLRVDSSTSQEVWDAALALTLDGSGMPSYFNTPAVARSLRYCDIPADRADDWAIVGCYEACPPGDTVPLTVGGGFALPEIISAYMQVADAACYDDFLEGFKEYFRRHYQEAILPGFNAAKNRLRENSATPFESICVRDCIGKNRYVTDMGGVYNLFGVNILGIGTLTDSIHTVRQVVYTEKLCTLKEFAARLEQDFPDEAFRRYCRNLPGRFGTDNTETNQLAHELSTLIADTVLKYPLDDGSLPYPAFFWFAADIKRSLPPTPDGRRQDERCSYGCNPSEGTVTRPTAALNSAAHVAQQKAACGNPFILSFTRREITAEKLRQLIAGYFAEGGTHIHVNIVSPEELKLAQAEPERFTSLQVRVSGFSARFVAIDRKWQDALIDRTGKGF